MIDPKRTAQRQAEMPVARLHELLVYDPVSGEIRWRVTRRRVRVGDVAGNKRWDGYVCVRINTVLLLAHRIAWALYYGDWPPADRNIDHVNRDPSDNRIVNLRLATHAQNTRNVGVRRDSQTGLRGVKRTPGGRFMARARYQKVRTYLGTFDTPEEAHAAVVAFIDSVDLLEGFRTREEA